MVLCCACNMKVATMLNFEKLNMLPHSRMEQSALHLLVKFHEYRWNSAVIIAEFHFWNLVDAAMLDFKNRYSNPNFVYQ